MRIGEDRRQAEPDADQTDETDKSAQVEDEQKRAAERKREANVEKPSVAQAQRQQAHQESADREASPISADPGAGHFLREGARLNQKRIRQLAGADLDAAIKKEIKHAHHNDGALQTFGQWRPRCWRRFGAPCLA